MVYFRATAVRSLTAVRWLTAVGVASALTATRAPVNQATRAPTAPRTNVMGTATAAETGTARDRISK